MEKLNTEKPDVSYEKVFDSLADSYDDTFDSNPVTVQLRQTIYSYILPFLDKDSNILDINCGTGTDAYYFASRGCKVTCLDISSRMLDHARSKLERFPNVDLRTGSFEKPGLLTSAPYDLILSNFGGLNCTSELRTVFTRCYEHLKPGGRFVLVIMPPISLWEVFSGFIRFNLKYAFRRIRKNPAVQVENYKISVFYHSLQSIRKVSRSLFKIKTVRGLNVLSPPPYSRKFVSKYPRISVALNKLDRFIGIAPFTRSLGDHTLIVLRKEV